MLSIIGTPVVTSWDILLKWRRCIVKIAEDLLKKSARYDMANSLSVTGDISIWTLHQNIVNSRSGTTVSRSVDRKSLPVGVILPSNETQARQARTDFELLKSKLVGCLSLSTRLVCPFASSSSVHCDDDEYINLCLCFLLFLFIYSPPFDHDPISCHL